MKKITQTDIEAAANLLGESYSQINLIEWKKGFEIGCHWILNEKERREIFSTLIDDSIQKDLERSLDL